MTDGSKVVSLTEACRLTQTAQQRGETVVLCHGCFDIVHPGHIRHLTQAARQGDHLIVTITGDGLVNKGDNRPLIPQDLRAENLAALSCVDWVAINDRPTAVELLEMLRPNVYVKGREYEQNSDPRFAAERQTVERHGGRIVFSSGDVVFSSTALIRAMEQAVDPFQAALQQLAAKHNLTERTLGSVVDQFAGKRVMVIGEVLRDTYVICDRPDIASESPMMTLRPIEYRSTDGGAAIIAQHIAAMGGRATLATILPRSVEAEAVRQRLAAQNIDVCGIEVDGGIVEKQRFLVGTSKVMKLDIGDPLTLSATDQRRFIDAATEAAPSCDAVIIADFGQGLFTPAVTTKLCQALRPHVNVMAGDVSGRHSNLCAFRQMDVLCPSEHEARDGLHEHDHSLNAVIWRLLRETESRSALVKIGDEGLIAFEQRDKGRPSEWSSPLLAEHIPAFSLYAVDQLGCGDALLAAATLSLTTGASLVHCAVLGNIAASAQAQRLGNAVIGALDLRRGIRRIDSAGLTIAAPAHQVIEHKHDHISVSHT